MTKTTHNQALPLGVAGDDKLGLRFLINNPTLGWRTLPMNKALSAQRGDLQLSELSGQTVKVAFAHVTMRRGKVINLRRVQISEWKLDSDGRVDQEAVMSGIIARLDTGADSHTEDPRETTAPSKAELTAIRRALGC